MKLGAGRAPMADEAGPRRRTGTIFQAHLGKNSRKGSFPPPGFGRMAHSRSTGCSIFPTAYRPDWAGRVPWHRACVVTGRTFYARSGRSPAGRVGTSTILLVEDEADCADMLCAFLVSHGYRVVVAYNGAEALQRVMREKPDLILSDVMMPVMDGVEMGRRLSQDEACRSIPLAFITAVPGWRIAHDCPFAAYLRKPLDLDLLLDTVSRLTRHQSNGHGQSLRAES
jgi:CheY-like chemotaxis protein